MGVAAQSFEQHLLPPLDVRRRRPDGYHDLETLFAFCRDGDVISLAPAPADSFAITGPFGAALAGEGDNLVTRARDAFRAAFGVSDPCAIVLEKNLPVASGIGGGSADAAATLRALARLHGVTGWQATRLDLDAASTSIVEVMEWSIQEVARLAGTTSRTLRHYDDTGLVPPSRVGANGYRYYDADALVRLQRVLLLRQLGLGIPVIAEVLAALEALAGARLARMSGSGATCFALVDDAKAAAATIGARYPGWWMLATELR